jgi:hypothetical protein
MSFFKNTGTFHANFKVSCRHPETKSFAVDNRRFMPAKDRRENRLLDAFTIREVQHAGKKLDEQKVGHRFA